MGGTDIVYRWEMDKLGFANIKTEVKVEHAVAYIL